MDAHARRGSASWWTLNGLMAMLALYAVLEAITADGWGATALWSALTLLLAGVLALVSLRADGCSFARQAGTTARVVMNRHDRAVVGSLYVAGFLAGAATVLLDAPRWGAVVAGAVVLVPLVWFVVRRIEIVDDPSTE